MIREREQESGGVQLVDEIARNVMQATIKFES
jgi:hypothetical protein